MSGRKFGFDDLFRSINGSGDHYSEEGRRQRYGVYLGFVTNNEDDEQRGRVKAEVPTIIPETTWAMPFGCIGAGEGDFDIPKLGQPVAVMFLSGHIDYPIYLPGWFGAPKGKSDAPVQAIRKETKITQKPQGDKIKRPTNKVYRRDDFVVEIDGTPGQEKLRLFDEKTGSQVRIDRKRNIVLIYGKGDVVVETSGKFVVNADGGVDMDGANTRIGHGGQQGASRISDHVAGAAHGHPTGEHDNTIDDGSDNVTIGKGGGYRGRQYTQ